MAIFLFRTSGFSRFLMVEFAANVCLSLAFGTVNANKTERRGTIKQTAGKPFENESFGDKLLRPNSALH